MSIFLLKSSTVTALAIGDNGTGFKLVRPNWENIRAATFGVLLGRIGSTGQSTTQHRSLDECLGACGLGTRLRDVETCSPAADRGLMNLLGALGVSSVPVDLIAPSVLNNSRFLKLAASDLLACHTIGAINIGDWFAGLWRKSEGARAAASATGSFSGDLLFVLKEPENYLVTALEKFVRENPYVNLVFEAKDFGIAIGTAIETSLSFEHIAAGMKLTIADIRKIETTHKTQPVGESGDVRKMTPRELGILMYYSELTPDANMIVANTITDVMNSVCTAAKSYVISRLNGLFWGAVSNKIFPGDTSLLKLPKTPKEWLNDLGRTATDEIQKKVEAVAIAKI